MSKSYSAPCGKYSLCMFNMTILSKLHYQCPFVWLLCTLGSTRQCTPAWSWRPWSWYSLQRTQHFPPPDDYLCVIAQCELHHLTRNMMMLSARNHVRLLTLYNSMSFSYQLYNMPEYEAIDKIQGILLMKKPVDHLQPEKQCPQYK